MRLRTVGLGGIPYSYINNKLGNTMRYPKEDTQRDIHKDYGVMLTTLLLCNEFNPESDKALRRCAKKLSTSMVTREMREVCAKLPKVAKRSLLHWLQEKIDELEVYTSIPNFLIYSRTGDQSVLGW